MDCDNDSSREDLLFEKNLPDTCIADEFVEASESDYSKWSYTYDQGEDDNYDMEMGWVFDDNRFDVGDVGCVLCRVRIT